MRHCRSLLFLLPWILLGSVSSRTLAQATRTTILTNGPTSNRINIVVLSEGYQTNQLGQFLVDATNAVNNLLTAYQALTLTGLQRVNIPSKIKPK